MAPPLLFDITGIDLEATTYGVDVIEEVNPHRGVMRMLDRIVFESDDRIDYIACKDIGHDEFWVPGHIPGRPIFPGVLMIEAAAQLASFICLRKMKDTHFMGFAGVDGVKFRGQVEPGDRFVLLVHEDEIRPRRSTSRAQGLVNGNLVFEATIKGMPM